MTTTTAPVNLAAVVHESEEAAREAAALFAKANAAQAKADDARRAVEAQAAERGRAFLAKLTADYPAARETAVTAVADTRQALLDAMQDGGNVFTCYLAWVQASIHAWALEEEIGEVRNQMGRPGRTPNPPSFSFAHDIALIVDTLAMQAQDEAIQQIRERRAAFMRGQEN